MSSTSSSECDCGLRDYYEYNANVRNVQGPPCYPTLRHPLIYCTQVQQPVYRKQRSREMRKGNPNFFVKAFRWYTQEHRPPHEDYSKDHDLTSFAKWLDDKYNQFLLDSQMEDVNDVKMKQTFVINADKLTNGSACRPCKTKIFARVKSPWRKRRHPISSKEDGDMLRKSHDSLKYILAPKDVIRQTSCCQQSVTTVVSETEIQTKIVLKSQSLTSVRVRGSEHKPNDVISVQEGNKIGSESGDAGDKEIKRIDYVSNVYEAAIEDAFCQCPEECAVKRSTETQDNTSTVAKCVNCSLHKNSTVSTIDKNQVNTSEVHRDEHKKKRGKKPKKCELEPQNPYINDVSCQCSEIITRMDAESQYSDRKLWTECICTGAYHKHESLMKVPTLQRATRCDMSLSPYCISQKCQDKQCLSNKPVFPISNNLNTSKVTSYNAYSINNTVQTSDHSICFENQEYPLFMKIFCADKLSEDFIYR
ncbi:uncharacterized protein LOC131844382 isoform X2 [Achroia grisella]|uniref:uncharacterized protein LOC131844382 isoform X2 n=1 Tax=Achroia grisella TaxID=688607 RepID=UPI0027D21C02|nr:uncharacterized protein LOC131844382 isoform X2 [Achroia grisella]